MNKNIYLSALGWVADSPQGNRLRWHYPLQMLDASDQYLGLPQSIIVERAPVNNTDLFQAGGEASTSYPYTWWEQHDNIVFTNWLPLYVHQLDSPVQAIVFTWRGDSTRILLRDTQSNITVADRLVSDGERVYVEAPMIDEIMIFSTTVTLEDLRTLDLFHDHGLKWKQIAEIKVAETFTKDLNIIGMRYNMVPTLTNNKWKELVKLANAARASIPTDTQNDELSLWDTFELVLSLRWEFALLGGFGFFDGPRTNWCELDKTLGDLLSTPPSTMMAYRVRESDARASISNLVLCQPSYVTPLKMPSIPQYIAPEVRLPERTISRSGRESGAPVLTGSMHNFSPLVEYDGDFEVRLTMRLEQSDSRAQGVEVEEIIENSPTTRTGARQQRFLSRSRRPEDPPMQISLVRSFDVNFPDVMLQARVRAIDAWDRVSAYSQWTPPTALLLRHEPPAPSLSSAIYETSTGTVRITRALGLPNIPDWEPDQLVHHTAGRVFIYRQHMAPRMENVMVELPLQISGELYSAKVNGVANLSDFIGGSLSVGGFTETIISVNGNDVHFRVPDNGGGVVQLFSSGTGRIVQDLKHATLWSKVADFPAVALPSELVFNDPLPSPMGVAVESYLARLVYFGQLGPESNIVRAIRHPEIPTVPPPFTVEILGIDFFNRTMLKIRFTTPVGSGRYSVWWAEGIVSPTELANRGASGLYGAQEALNGYILYDVIALPIPQHVSRTITVGVQHVIKDSTQSNFITIPVVIPALSP